MSNAYSSLCDDFYLDMYVNTELELPTQRDTVLENKNTGPMKQ